MNNSITETSLTTADGTSTSSIPNNWPQQHAIGIPYVVEFPNPEIILSHSLFSDYENGSCFGDFTIGFLMPTQVSGSSPWGDPINIETTTFTNNSIKLYTIGPGNFWEQPFVPDLQIVPEPATLLLLTLGGLILRKKIAGCSVCFLNLVI